MKINFNEDFLTKLIGDVCNFLKVDNLDVLSKLSVIEIHKRFIELKREELAFYLFFLGLIDKNYRYKEKYSELLNKMNLVLSVNENAMINERIENDDILKKLRNYCEKYNALKYEFDISKLKRQDKEYLDYIYIGLYYNTTELSKKMSDEALLLVLNELTPDDFDEDGKFKYKDMLHIYLFEKKCSITTLKTSVIVNYLKQRDASLKSFYEEVFDNKECFDNINNIEVYENIFIALSEEKKLEMIEYMISNDKLSDHLKKLSIGDRVNLLAKNEPLTETKYKKWLLENGTPGDFLKKILEMYAKGTLNIELDYVKIFINWFNKTSSTKEVIILFNELPSNKKINFLCSVYKAIGSTDMAYHYYELTSDIMINLFDSEIDVEIIEDILENTSDSDLKFFIVNSFIKLDKKNSIFVNNLKNILNYIAMYKGIEFYKTLAEYKTLNMSVESEYAPLSSILINAKKEWLEDEECVKNMLICDCNRIFNNRNRLTIDIIKSMKNFPQNWYKADKKLLSMIIKYNSSNLLWNNGLEILNNILKNFEEPLSEEDKEIIISLKDTPVASKLLSHYEFLKNNEEFIKSAIEKDPYCIFLADKKFHKLELVKELDFSNNLNSMNYLFNDALFDRLNMDVDFTCELINNEIIKPSRHVLNALVKFLQDETISKKINSNFYQNFFDKNIDGFAKIYNSNNSIQDRLTDSTIGYIKVFGCNKVSEFYPQDYKNYFDKNGATEELKEFLGTCHEFTQKLLEDRLMHINGIIYSPTKELYELFEPFILSKYSISKEQLDYYISYLGYKLLFNLSNENISQFIKLPIEEGRKIINLLKGRTATAAQISDVMLDSMLQSEFSLNNKSDVEIFSYIQATLLRISSENLKKWFYYEYNDDNTLELDKMLSKICTITNIDLGTLKKAVLYSKSGTVDSLHNITNLYVSTLREKYRKNNTDFAFRIGFEYIYDEDDAIKKLMPYFLKRNDDVQLSGLIPEIYDYLDKIDFDMLKDYIPDLNKEEYELILDVINKNDGSKISKINKKKISIVRNVIKQKIRATINNDLKIQPFLNKLNVKKKYKIELCDVDFIKIIGCIDANIFINRIYSDEKVYNHMLKIFDKYYLGQIPVPIERFCENTLNFKLLGGINNIGTFIMKYENMLRAKQSILKHNTGQIIPFDKITFNFSELVNLISAANSYTNEVARLMGKSEYIDFINEPEPNKNCRNKTVSEQKIIPIINFLYSLDAITIPSHDCIISSEKIGKSINMIVGNRTNTSNLCHGERTGACMRLNGVGEGLFLKCLTDKNWFHIRFEDPTTHEYISRVSGFRNGNTVYLNQLRCSGNKEKYLDTDLQEFIKIYADSLIEETKNSQYPVENVFINTSFAMEKYSDSTYFLGDKITDGYELGKYADYGMRKSQMIWTDVSNSAYLLATTDAGKKLPNGYASIESGPEKVEIYKPIRDKIYGIYFEEDNSLSARNIVCTIPYLVEKINQINALMELFNGKDYRYDILDIISVDKIKDGFVGPDWYVYINEEDNIIYGIMENEILDNQIACYHDYESSQVELDKYKSKLENRYNLNKVK